MLFFLLSSLLAASPAMAAMTVSGDEILEQFSQPIAFEQSRSILNSGTVLIPWLTVVGLHESEQRSANALASTIYKEFGLRTIMLSKWNGIQVPGFDGVLVDDNGRPVANLSLKELSGGQKSFKGSIEEAE